MSVYGFQMQEILHGCMGETHVACGLINEINICVLFEYC